MIFLLSSNNCLFIIMFSVIIPLFNKAPYIFKAIKSVLNQNFQEFEIIIIDDGSTDESAETVRAIINTLTAEDIKRISFIIQRNKGVSATRNLGFEKAKYEYVTFLDADDWWEPSFLEKLNWLIELYPDAGIYGSSYYKVKYGKNIPAEIGVEKDFVHGLINYFDVYAKTLWMPLSSISIIIKKGVFNLFNGFNPNLKLGEDFDLWARIASRYPVAYLNIPLAYYNQDVEVETRAVGVRLYEPEEHMLFTTYNEELTSNPDFVHLFERLALYGLLPYYLNNKNIEKVTSILSKVDWSKHELKYSLYYRYLPKIFVRFWFSMLKAGSGMKKLLIRFLHLKFS